MKRVWLLLMIMLVMVAPLAAQDTDPGLEGLTADSAPYWGQTVTLEGIVVEYVNSYSFVLGEGAALDDDRVLVINDTGRPLPASLIRGERARVTGLVLPQLDAYTNDVNAGPVVDTTLNDPLRVFPGGSTTGSVIAPSDVGGGTGSDSPMDQSSDATQVHATPNMEGTPMEATELAGTPMLSEGTPNAGDTSGTGDTTSGVEATSTADASAVQGGTPSAGDTSGGVTVTPITGDSAIGVTVTPMPGDSGDTGMGTDMTDDFMSFWDDSIRFYYSGNLPDDYNNYTIIRLTSINQVQWLSTDAPKR